MTYFLKGSKLPVVPGETAEPSHQSETVQPGQDKEEAPEEKGRQERHKPGETES